MRWDGDTKRSNQNHLDDDCELMDRRERRIRPIWGLGGEIVQSTKWDVYPLGKPSFRFPESPMAFSQATAQVQ